MIKFSILLRLFSQLIFLLAPIPAYLPQYLTLKKNTRKTDYHNKSSHGDDLLFDGEGEDENLLNKNDLENGCKKERSDIKEKSQQDAFLLDKEDSDDDASSIDSYTLNNNEEGAGEQSTIRLTSNAVEQDIHNNNISATSTIHARRIYSSDIDKGTDMKKELSAATNNKSNYQQSQQSQTQPQGFSPISIFILILAHLLRILYYFHIAIILFIRQKKSVPTFRFIFPERQFIPNVKYDVVLNSFVMLGVQLLLLHASIDATLVQRRIKIRLKKASEKTYHTNNNNNSNEDNRALDTTQTISSLLTLSTPINYDTIQQIKSSIHSFLELDHFWEWDNFSSHIRFLSCLALLLSLCYTTSMILSWLLFTLDINLFFFLPTLRSQQELRQLLPKKISMLLIHIYGTFSVLLESSLALPQIITNYKSKSTLGLSLIMVMCWINGDIMKFIYFRKISQNNEEDISGDESENDDSNERTSPNQIMFEAGCIFSLLLDLTVGIQMIHLYPTPKLRTQKNWLKKKLRNVFRREFYMQQFDHMRERGRITRPFNLKRSKSNPETLPSSD